jgi:hypothetical protein
MATSFPAHVLSVANIAVSRTTSGLAAAWSGADIDKVVSASITLRRSPIIGRSDDSYYPTVLDVVHDGYEWEIMCRDMEHAHAWVRESYLRQIQLCFYDAARGATNMYAWLQGIAITRMEWGTSWNQLTPFVIGGFASRCLLNDADNIATAVKLEGDLTVRSASSSFNAPADGDFVNQWDVYGFS